MHADGFLRERAVRALAVAEGETVARFLVVRSVDHVQQVRDPALAALLTRKDPAEVEQVLELLLRVRTRTHGALALTSYVEKLDASRGREYPRDLLTADTALVRRFGLEAATTRGMFDSSELEERLATETDQWSRRLLAEHWMSLDPTRAKAKLLHSKYVEGRLIALQSNADDQFDRSDLERRMLDRSSRVRAAARWRYRRAGHDPAAYYRARWKAGDEAITLAGLWETGQVLTETEALEALSSEDPRTRLAALYLSPKESRSKSLLLSLLSDPSRAVVKHAAQLLAAYPSTRYDDVAGAAASESPSQRRAAWLVRGDLEAMHDPEAELAGEAERDLMTWLERRAAITYKLPLPSQREAIQSLLGGVELSLDAVARIAFHAGV
jgi:hypothetical protein